MTTTRRSFLAALALAPFAALLGKSAEPPVAPNHVITYHQSPPPGEVAWSATDDPESWNTGDYFALAS